MQNKNTLNVNVGEHYRASTDNRPADEFSVENIPLHSMKKDLEIIANPDLLRQESAPLPVSLNSPSISSSKISPFLEKTSPSFAAPVSQKNFSNTTVSSTDKQLLNQELDDTPKEFDLKKIFVFSTIFLSIIALGVGSYYFWFIRGEKSEPLTHNPIEESPLPAAIVEPEIKKEEPRENVIILDLGNLTSAKIKTELKNQIEKLPKESLNKPLEFKLKDPQNNLIPFSSFAKKSEMTFAQNLSANLGESFSLLAFNDRGNLATGLIIESKNDALLAREMLKKELALPKDLNVIFLTVAPTTAKKVSFSNSNYKDISLRFFNLISPEKLSIDYTVAKNKLIIGTTWNTLSALYDWLLLQSDMQ